jgi:hypothetical protein
LSSESTLLLEVAGCPVGSQLDRILGYWVVDGFVPA